MTRFNLTTDVFAIFLLILILCTEGITNCEISQIICDSLRLALDKDDYRGKYTITSGSPRLPVLFILGYTLLGQRLCCVFSFSEWHLGELVYSV